MFGFQSKESLDPESPSPPYPLNLEPKVRVRGLTFGIQYISMVYMILSDDIRWKKGHGEDVEVKADDKFRLRRKHTHFA